MQHDYVYTKQILDPSGHILHKNHAGFFWARFFLRNRNSVTIKIYKEYSKMDWKRIETNETDQ